MKMVNLQASNTVTVTDCDTEPIHIPGSIQLYGFLLAVDANDFTIRYCSENCTDFLQTGLSQILGSSLATYFNEGEIKAFTGYYQQEPTELARPFLFTRGGKSYNTSAHVNNDCIVLEFEAFTEDTIELPDLFIQTKRFAYHTQRTDNLKSFCEDIANETKTITGFDRVMIYRFDEQANGEVIAEAKREDLEPFLGLKYPHTDIPVQARNLFFRNLVRLIADVHYTPVPLYGLENETHSVQNLDLSLSALRSVSPIHIEYLKNMGVTATFNIAIIHNQKLWGLISCHHYTTRYIPYYTRLAAHLQAIFLASQIDVRELADNFELVKTTDIKLNELNENLTGNTTEILNEKGLQKLQQLLNADGFVFKYKNQLYTSGSLPPNQDIEKLIEWIASNNPESFSCDKLIDDYQNAESLHHTIAGVFYFGLANNNCLLWTRGEVATTINWAGNPDNAILTNEVTKGLTPRKSFELWKEMVQHQCVPWKKAELNAGATIASMLQRKLHIDYLNEEEERYLTLNQKLKKANDELANMSWISTHDLKEPLRKIQIYASVILENEANELPDKVKTNVTRMQKSAARMQILIEDLMAYTRIVNEEKRFENVNLNLILDEVQAALKETVDEKEFKIEWQNLPVVKGIPFQLQQLFTNLISNSIKFSKPALPAHIIVRSEKLQNSSAENNKTATPFFYKISVRDNGLGFNNAYSHEVFKIFKRMHSNQYTGTGIGLAICQKIAESHGGSIEAISVEGEGATFTIYLPADELPG